MLCSDQLGQVGFPPSRMHKVAPIFFYEHVRIFFTPGVRMYHQDICVINLLSFIPAGALTSWSLNAEDKSLRISGKFLLIFLFLHCLSSASRSLIRQTLGIFVLSFRSPKHVSGINIRIT